MATEKVRYTLCIRWPEDGVMRLHGLWMERQTADSTVTSWRRIFAKRGLDVTVDTVPIYPSTASWRDHGRAS